jgi:hypothetical protein
VDGVGGRFPVGGAAGPEDRPEDVHAPITAAEAAPRKARRVMATPHSGPPAQAWMVTKLNTAGLAGFTVALTQVGVNPG